MNRRLVVRVAVVTGAHTHIFMNDGSVTVVPLFCQKGNLLAIRNGIKNVGRSLGNKKAIALAHVYKLFSAVGRLSYHHALPRSD